MSRHRWLAPLSSRISNKFICYYRASADGQTAHGANSQAACTKNNIFDCMRTISDASKWNMLRLHYFAADQFQQRNKKQKRKKTLQTADAQDIINLSGVNAFYICIR